jgi:hypothetical protein
MKKYKFTVYEFDPKTKEIVLTDEYKTMAISEKRFKIILKTYLKSRKNFCYFIKQARSENESV